jgi:hypothetical protein
MLSGGIEGCLQLKSQVEGWEITQVVERLPSKREVEFKLQYRRGGKKKKNLPAFP